MSTIEIRQTDVYADWFSALKDREARARINVRIRRLSLGNPGDVKSVGKACLNFESIMARGYRVYFVRRGEVIVILLCGGDKRSQVHDIARAIALAKEI